MAHAPLADALDQRVRVHRIVAVIAERIANRVRHDDRGGEMDNGVEAGLRDQRTPAGVVSDAPRCSAINAAPRGWSPTSPVTSDAPFATAQSKPVARLSSTTTRSPASTSA